MNHKGPIIDDPDAGPGFHTLAERLLRNAVALNPLTAAIYEEVEPDLQRMLKESLGNQNEKLAEVHNLASRAHRIAMNAAGKVQAARGAEKKP